MVKILCLSDIHYSEKKNNSVYADDSSIELRNSVGKNDLNILLSSIEKIGPIDLLVICGDVVVGKDSDTIKDESLNEIKDFIDRISHLKKFL